MKELQYLNKYFIKYKFHFLLGIVITIAAQIFSLFTPELIKDSMKAVEDIHKQGLPVSDIKAQLNENILLIVATTLIAGVLTFFMRQTIIVMSRHVEFDLKNEVFQQYERLSQNFYKQKPHR
jgi:ATP-binding cassette subfamily B multidrug efflux pump